MRRTFCGISSSLESYACCLAFLDRDDSIWATSNCCFTPCCAAPASHTLVLEGFLFLFYVKVGKYHHRDHMLSLYDWRGDEQVLDVGCGRGLLLAGAAKKLDQGGAATGNDIWSQVDMGGNSEKATQHNLDLEGVTPRCNLLSVGAQEMPFPTPPST